MNTGEKLAATYLRLNGFLLLPYFTVFSGAGFNHVDLIGYRPAGSRELVFDRALPRDGRFSALLTQALGADSATSAVGIICESRGNQNRDEICDEHVRYIGSFLGDLAPVRVTFCKAPEDLSRDEHGIRVDLLYAYRWIQRRITRMEGYGIHKTGSWVLSEEFLGDLLSLRRIGVRLRARWPIRRRRRLN